LSITILDRDDYTVGDFFADYRAGKLGRKAAAVIGIEAAKYSSGINKDQQAYRLVTRRVWDPDYGRYVNARMAMCPTCGGLYDPDEKIPYFCNKLIKVPVMDEFGKVVEEQERECKGAMFELTRWRREGLSQILQRKFKHQFKLYIADEIHKQKGGSTDAGAADSRLVESIKYGLALTGTLFGGYASSIFYLLYRRNREVRKLYSYYGLWERRWCERDPREVGRSWVTGKKRWGLRSKEMPGISPAVIRYMLPIVLFGKITDLGYELPPLREHIDTLEMTGRQAEQYEFVDAELLRQAMELLMREGDPGAIAKWFSTIRYRPMSAFRSEMATYQNENKGTFIDGVHMPPVVSDSCPWLPKEERLAEIVRENAKVNRKTLVFVEQTGTRDIRDRLVSALNELAPMANVAKLSASDMSPAKREAWIKANTPNMDVLIVNPKLVETGLDLVMFNDILFYELPLSLYTLWQAMRRVWRLGQKYAVNCRFMVYEGTIEQAMLQRMGAKLKAAMLLYGDEAAGAIIESDETDIQREMIRNALAGKSYKNLDELNDAGGLVQGLFATGTEKEVVVTDSPMGSPIAQSIPIPGIELTLDFEGPAQLSLFGDPVPASQVRSRKRR
jgi:hypothetical protein